MFVRDYWSRTLDDSVKDSFASKLLLCVIAVIVVTNVVIKTMQIVDGKETNGKGVYADGSNNNRQRLANVQRRYFLSGFSVCFCNANQRVSISRSRTHKFSFPVHSNTCMSTQGLIEKFVAAQIFRSWRCFEEQS